MGDFSQFNCTRIYNKQVGINQHIVKRILYAEQISLISVKVRKKKNKEIHQLMVIVKHCFKRIQVTGMPGSVCLDIFV